MNIKDVLASFGITPDPLQDQFFLWDDTLVKKIVSLAELNSNDVVLEVGAGIGNLTKELAKSAGKVISFEKDRRFEKLLSALPKNVEIHLEDAWNYVQLHGKFKKKKDYNKIVSNLPYSFAEQFFHNLTFLEYDKAIFMVPISFVENITSNPIFSSFFTPEIKLTINKEVFYPIPKTNSAVIDLRHLPDPIENRNLSLYLRQYIYQHEPQKTKNSLLEGIIKFTWLTEKTQITKNQAGKILNDTKIDTDLLEKSPDNSEIYSQITEKFSEPISFRRYSSASS